jgi:hypothetical protein
MSAPTELMLTVTVREPDGPLLQMRIYADRVECGLPDTRPNIEIMREPTLQLVKASIDALLADRERKAP